jgi:hypothetical protein
VGNATYWNGNGAVSFGALPGGVSLRLAFGSQNVTVLNTTGVQPGFFFGDPIGAGGTFHEHLGSWLDGATLGTHDGIYLIGLQLKVDSDGGSLPYVGDLFSEPKWIVYNNGLDEIVHDAAIDWVETNVVPEPAAMVSMVIGSILILVGFRRKVVRLRRTAA